MTWWHAVVEARHELMNPTSPEKIRLLGERLGLRPDSHAPSAAATPLMLPPATRMSHGN